ncbi:MAG: hypothetical protein ACOYJQ_07090 [Pseudochelatococcus sp.]|jgi:hypothetical protein|uniref:hypothetical protein n=1 Tax=Pseudochelatococcus sp. TaxID=2020869 RepID=UPI003D92A3F0
MTPAKFNRSLTAASYEETRADRSVAWLLVLMLVLVFLPVMGVWCTAFFTR